jgi:hypothetical protein
MRVSRAGPQYAFLVGPTRRLPALSQSFSTARWEASRGDTEAVLPPLLGDLLSGNDKFAGSKQLRTLAA